MEGHLCDFGGEGAFDAVELLRGLVEGLGRSLIHIRRCRRNERCRAWLPPLPLNNNRTESECSTSLLDQHTYDQSR